MALTDLLNHIKTLINQYTYTKTQTKENFDAFIRDNVRYINGNFVVNELIPLVIWQPELNGETGARYQYSYSEANGEAVGKGFIFDDGFDNTELWELSFEFRHDNIRYTGICFLVDMNGTYNGVNGTGNKVSTWEGSWAGGEKYATFADGTIDWFDVTVTKIDSTHIRLQSATLDRDTTVEATWLPNAEKLSFGAVHNNASSSYGPVRIRNIKVVGTV